VTSSPALIQATLDDFLHGRQKVSLPPVSTPRPASHGHHGSSAGASPAAIGLYPTSGQSQAVSAALSVPFRVLYPALQTGPASQEQVHSYVLRDDHNRLRHAYVAVWRQNGLGGYYDLEGTDWTNPPLIAHPDESRKIAGHTYMIFSDGGHIHTVAWRSGHLLYWLTNTLLEDLTNQQMLGIARSAQGLH
jgi:polyisoprenyl-teichoic acid--peptidoglycan teichoic acid transferase